jgi:hypothetical protein
MMTAREFMCRAWRRCRKRTYEWISSDLCATGINKSRGLSG